MTIKTKKLLDEMTDALFEKKSVLLTGNTGVGKYIWLKRFLKSWLKENIVAFRQAKIKL